MLALKSEFLKKLVFELPSDTNFGPFVSPAIGRLGERMAAMLALERLDVQVNTRVVKSTRQASESLLTLLAGQYLLQLACTGIFSKATSYKAFLLLSLLGVCFLLSLALDKLHRLNLHLLDSLVINYGTFIR